MHGNKNIRITDEKMVLLDKIISLLKQQGLQENKNSRDLKAI